MASQRTPSESTGKKSGVSTKPGDYNEEIETPGKLYKQLKKSNILFTEKGRDLGKEEVKNYIRRIGAARLKSYLFLLLDESERKKVATRKNNDELPTKFAPNTTFEDVKKLYDFDIGLRGLIIEALGDIEVALRSVWATSLAERTNDAHAYMIPIYFRKGEEAVDEQVLKNWETHKPKSTKLKGWLSRKDRFKDYLQRVENKYKSLDYSLYRELSLYPKSYVNLQYGLDKIYAELQELEQNPKTGSENPSEENKREDVVATKEKQPVESASHAKPQKKKGPPPEYDRAEFKSYKDKYNNPLYPPIWTVTSIMTLGNIIDWIEMTLEPSVKEALYQILGIKKEIDYLELLNHLRKLRNICAHNHWLLDRPFSQDARIYLPADRFYKGAYSKNPVANDLSWDDWKTKGGQIYSELILLCFLMHSIKGDFKWAERLLTLLNAKPKEEELRMMGFPPEWKEFPFWQTIKNSLSNTEVSNSSTISEETQETTTSRLVNKAADSVAYMAYRSKRSISVDDAIFTLVAVEIRRASLSDFSFFNPLDRKFKWRTPFSMVNFLYTVVPALGSKEIQTAGTSESLRMKGGGFVFSKKLDGFPSEWISTKEQRELDMAMKLVSVFGTKRIKKDMEESASGALTDTPPDLLVGIKRKNRSREDEPEWRESRFKDHFPKKDSK